jgi:hypothetical protein
VSRGGGRAEQGCTITTYRDPDRAAGLCAMRTLVDALSSGFPHSRPSSSLTAGFSRRKSR